MCLCLTSTSLDFSGIPFAWRTSLTLFQLTYSHVFSNQLVPLYSIFQDLPCCHPRAESVVLAPHLHGFRTDLIQSVYHFLQGENCLLTVVPPLASISSKHPTVTLPNKTSHPMIIFTSFPQNRSASSVSWTIIILLSSCPRIAPSRMFSMLKSEAILSIPDLMVSLSDWNSSVSFNCLHLTDFWHNLQICS